MRKIAIRRSVNRENLFLGGDRELVMSSALLAVTLIFAVQNLWAAIFGILVWILGLRFLRKMAKNDPKLRHVYLRHRLYKKYYPAHSTPWRINQEGQGRRYK